MAERFNGGGGTSTTLEMLDAISRTRPLTRREEYLLEKAIIRSGECRRQRWWTRGDVVRLRRYLIRGKKPAQIAPLMGRTERAIWRKMYLLGWTVTDAGKSSIALPAPK